MRVWWNLCGICGSLRSLQRKPRAATTRVRLEGLGESLQREPRLEVGLAGQASRGWGRGLRITGGVAGVARNR